MTRAARSNGRSPATYSLAVKTAAVLLLTVTAFFTAVSGVGIGLSAVYGIYDGVSQEQLLADLTESYLDRAMHDGTNHYLSDPDGMDSWIRAWSGLYYQVKDGDGNVLSGNHRARRAVPSGMETYGAGFGQPCRDQRRYSAPPGRFRRHAHMVSRNVPEPALSRAATALRTWRCALPVLPPPYASPVFLLSAAGRHPGEDGVREGAIDRVPFDLFTFSSVCWRR